VTAAAPPQAAPPLLLLCRRMVLRYTCSAAATIPGGPAGLQLFRSLPWALLLLLLLPRLSLLLVVVVEEGSCLRLRAREWDPPGRWLLPAPCEGEPCATPALLLLLLLSEELPLVSLTPGNQSCRTCRPTARPFAQLQAGTGAVVAPWAMLVKAFRMSALCPVASHHMLLRWWALRRGRRSLCRSRSSVYDKTADKLLQKFCKCFCGMYWRLRGKRSLSIAGRDRSGTSSWSPRLGEPAVYRDAPRCDNTWSRVLWMMIACAFMLVEPTSGPFKWLYCQLKSNSSRARADGVGCQSG
jgi:hypothetical protein